MAERIAIVIQRFHETIVGGSEALASQYAHLLKDNFQVDILTTTALDYVTWPNDLPEGDEMFNGICVRRFRVSIGRSDYWHRLNQRLQQMFFNEGSANDYFHAPWSLALQEEYIRHQGPYSQNLFDFLKHSWQDYSAIIFTTYLYPTTYFGIKQVPPSRSILIPTLHNEPNAYFSVYRYQYQSVSTCLWLTNAERQLGESVWGRLPGEVTAMHVNVEPYEPYKSDYPYLLYSGRIESSKGCETLFQFFLKFKQDYTSNLRLVLTGKRISEIPNHSDIDFRGYVSAEEKFQLMAGACLFVMPSPYESFSIVTLEAMAQKTPVLVNAGCEVLVEHVNRSGGGRLYNNYEEFARNLRELITNPQKRLTLGQQGRDYVVQNFSEQGVRDRLLQVIKRCVKEQHLV
jgi:glycosyltransferase involved in cell wall biosynthesis